MKRFRCWFFGGGYAGLWSAKFLIADMMLNADVWGDVVNSALLRLRGADPRIESFAPGTALLSNFRGLKAFWGPAAIALFVIYPLATKRGRSGLQQVWVDQKALVLVVAIPLLWLEALSNHSQVHAHFTQINFAPLAILAFICATGDVKRFAASRRQHLGVGGGLGEIGGRPVVSAMIQNHSAQSNL